MPASSIRMPPTFARSADMSFGHLSFTSFTPTRANAFTAASPTTKLSGATSEMDIGMDFPNDSAMLLPAGVSHVLPRLPLPPV